MRLSTAAGWISLVAASMPAMRFESQLSWLLLLLFFLPYTVASIGDRSPAYIRCLASCQSDTCLANRYHPSLACRLTRWSCYDDCGYRCMHHLTALSLSAGHPPSPVILAQLEGLPPNRVVQYHGKWPFYRFLGIQEPLSVLFSIGNMYMHIKYGLLGMKKRLPLDLPRPLRWSYTVVLPFAGINLWIWSSIFHTRDRPITEKLDYFSSALSMMCSLYVALIRLGGFYPSIGQAGSGKGRLSRPLLALLLASIFTAHVSYLSFWRFDYAYNMAFNVTLGLAHNLLWASWTLYHLFLPSSSSSLSASSIAESKPRRASHYKRPFLILTFFTSLTALELLDFPPIFYKSLDAHALWHLSTIYVVKWWYQCLCTDAWWLVGREEEYKEHLAAEERAKGRKSRRDRLA